MGNAFAGERPNCGGWCASSCGGLSAGTVHVFRQTIRRGAQRERY
jgi:hypothetical protein